MSISLDVDKLIEDYWNNNVLDKYVYRGMNKHDLVFPFDPMFRPFDEVKETLDNFFKILDKLIINNIAFDVVETHFGNTYVHDLKNIVKWSKRDISVPGIDFTSSYKEAQEYSDCWQGSQLKQNIKTIINCMHIKYKII